MGLETCAISRAAVRHSTSPRSGAAYCFRLLATKWRSQVERLTRRQSSRAHWPRCAPTDPTSRPAAAERLLTENARSLGAGKVLDVGGAFRAAGLDRVVTTPPPVTEAPVSSVIAGSRGVLTHAVAPPPAGGADPLAALGVRKPRVRSSAYRHGVLSVVVSRVPDFARAIFTVDSRRYARRSGKLRVRLARAPTQVSVLIDVPNVGRTGPVRVKVKRDKPRMARAR
jgi:hypothetical protein